ncbi:hypothetical protein BC567DRAFT_27718 [Phyllosticta citribraziliensis]
MSHSARAGPWSGCKVPNSWLTGHRNVCSFNTAFCVVRSAGRCKRDRAMGLVSLDYLAAMQFVMSSHRLEGVEVSFKSSEKSARVQGKASLSPVRDWYQAVNVLTRHPLHGDKQNQCSQPCLSPLQSELGFSVLTWRRADPPLLYGTMWCVPYCTYSKCHEVCLTAGASLFLSLGSWNLGPQSEAELLRR